MGKKYSSHSRLAAERRNVRLINQRRWRAVTDHRGSPTKMRLSHWKEQQEEKRDGQKLLLICRLTLYRKMPDTRLNVPKKNSAQKATPDSSRHSRAIGAEIKNKPEKNLSVQFPPTAHRPQFSRAVSAGCGKKNYKKKYLDLLQLDSWWCSCRAVDNMASFAKAITLERGRKPPSTWQPPSSWQDKLKKICIYLELWDFLYVPRTWDIIKFRKLYKGPIKLSRQTRCDLTSVKDYRKWSSK